MLPVLFVLALIFLPLILGIYGAYSVFQRYRHRRLLVQDVEQARDLEYPQQDIPMQDIDNPTGQYSSGQRYGSARIVSANVAPAAKSFPPTLQIKYTGGEGLVSAPERVFLFVEDGKRKGKQRAREDDQFQEKDMHAGKLWDWNTQGYGNTNLKQQIGLDIVVPIPRKAFTTTRKATSQPQRTNTAYDEKQTQILDFWNQLDNGQLPALTKSAEKALPKIPLVPTKDKDEASRRLEKGDLEDIDLDKSKKQWRDNKRAATPLPKLSDRSELFASTSTTGHANDLNNERPQSYVERKLNNALVTGLTNEVNRMAYVSRRYAELAKERAEKQKQEEEENRRDDERRLLTEEGELRETEQKRRMEEQQQRKAEERLRLRTTAAAGNEYRAEVDRTLKALEGYSERRAERPHTNDLLRTREDHEVQMSAGPGRGCTTQDDHNTDFKAHHRTPSRENSNTYAASKLDRKSLDKIFTRQTLGRASTYNEPSTRRPKIIDRGVIGRCSDGHTSRS
ncbi:hypothetical protein EJ02DRAFT_424389 [Clathrospora elynae]|uniref:Uncharacterized protein n=1 Tax=Clathrospora elynae TaxID=706981 RepID=A0A6A5SKM2_9PLEO|nr:hypothetical protein EJ02DRAFT_424389 [Clathrospora elynae]